MSVEVRIPTVLRKHTEGQATVTAEGTSVREVVADIAARYPDFRTQVIGDDGDLHRFINVYVNDEDVRYLEALDTKVSDGDVVSILPAVAGGVR